MFPCVFEEKFTLISLTSKSRFSFILFTINLKLLRFAPLRYVLFDSKFEELLKPSRVKVTFVFALSIAKLIVSISEMTLFGAISSPFPLNVAFKRFRLSFVPSFKV